MFDAIRNNVLNEWYDTLKRVRNGEAHSDDYSESNLCLWQREFAEENLHCSFLCSLGDWYDNVSDQLLDNRYDGYSDANPEPLFRYYTRLLLVISEIIEDYIVIHKKVMQIGKKDLAGMDLENYGLQTGDLKKYSNFINSVCKHKNEGGNLHLHNHHLKIEFEDFDDEEHGNQIRVNSLNWADANHETTILVPKLTTLIGIVIKLDAVFHTLMEKTPAYKETLKNQYTTDTNNINHD